MSKLGRRSLLTGALALAACKRGEPPHEDARSQPLAPPLPPPEERAREGHHERHELAFPDSASPRVIVLAPRAAPGVAHPVVIALHGRGEARKGATRGPLGWPEDYALERALARIARPPLVREDYFGFVTDAELAAQNRALATTPYRGLVVLCPYLPDLDLDDVAAQDQYGEFLTGTLLPRAREKLAILPGREHAGIDGVSLGGGVALHVGTRFPEHFGAVSGLQPAIQAKDAGRWAARFASATQRVGALAVRLQTSTGDPFRGPTRALSAQLGKLGVEHTFTETPGPHDYDYNRGPGAYGLLTFHDHALR